MKLLKFPADSVVRFLSAFPCLGLHCKPSSIFSLLIKGSQQTTVIELLTQLFAEKEHFAIPVFRSHLLNSFLTP